TLSGDPNARVIHVLLRLLMSWRRNRLNAERLQNRDVEKFFRKESSKDGEFSRLLSGRVPRFRIPVAQSALDYSRDGIGGATLLLLLCEGLHHAPHSVAIKRGSLRRPR